MLGGGLFLIAVSYLSCGQAALSVTLMTLGTTVSGIGLSGFFVNHMDIAPLYAGTLMGASNGIGAITGFIAPVVAAVLTVDVSQSPPILV